MMARSSTPRSRAARSRISSGASSGQRCSGTLRVERTSREQTRPGRRGLVTSPSTAAKTGTCSGSAGRRQPSSRAAVTCVNTAVSGRTSSHASRSRANSSSSLSPSRTERNRPWLTRRKPTRRTSPRIGRSWLSCVCMSRRLRRGCLRETTCRATCGRDRGSAACRGRGLRIGHQPQENRPFGCGWGPNRREMRRTTPGSRRARRVGAAGPGRWARAWGRPAGRGVRSAGRRAARR